MTLAVSYAKRAWLGLFASLLICVGGWHWAETILVPGNTLAAQSNRVPVGNNSDLYPRWFGARELLRHHKDPYSAEVTRGIQKGFYGRELDPQDPVDPSDQAGFAYPLYVVFILAPTISLPFSAVQAFAGWFMLAAIAASVPLWMYAMGFRSRWQWMLAGMVLAISSYPAVLEFHMQNLAAFVALLLALAAAAAAANSLFVCGVLLALSTIKPQLSGLFVLWFLLWTLTKWRERKRVAIGFGAAMFALAGGAELVQSRWIPEFFAAIREYGIYATDPSLVEFIFGPILGDVIAVGLCCCLVFIVWRWRWSAAGSADFGWALAWTASVTLAIIPVAVYNQVLLSPAFLVLLLDWNHFSGVFPRGLAKAAILCQGWQWITAMLIGICAFVITPEQLRFLMRVPFATLIALPAVVLLAIAATTVLSRGVRITPQIAVARHE